MAQTYRQLRRRRPRPSRPQHVHVNQLRHLPTEVLQPPRVTEFVVLLQWPFWRQRRWMDEDFDERLPWQRRRGRDLCHRRSPSKCRSMSVRLFGSSDPVRRRCQRWRERRGERGGEADAAFKACLYPRRPVPQSPRGTCVAATGVAHSPEIFCAVCRGYGSRAWYVVRSQFCVCCGSPG